MTAAAVAPVTISFAGRLGRDPERRNDIGRQGHGARLNHRDLPAGRAADPPPGGFR